MSPSSNSRRRFLWQSGAALVGWSLASRSTTTVVDAIKFQDDPFTLGVASGDPLPDGIVLWTRLAPDPLNGGGMPPYAVPVRWRIATDDNMQHIVQRGKLLATPELAHSVHVEVSGLEPARWYWYQFRVGDAFSPVGRTRTAPAPGDPTDHLALAFASCQNFTEGFYSSYRNMAQEDLDFVVHLGDYIYEGGGAAGRPRLHAPNRVIRSLDDYRTRHAQYKTDPDLQAAHAAFPWILTWDDHEVENNYSGSVSPTISDPELFLERRAVAYRAYYEHLPLRRSSIPVGPDLQLFRRLTFGDLAELNILDTRQYRTVQPGNCGDEERTERGHCPRAVDPAQTMLGDAQEEWLLVGLDASEARWNVLAQQTRFAQHDSNPDPARRDFGGGDNWNGYVVERQALIDFLGWRRPSNPIVITGDIHSNWAYDLKDDFDDAASETVGTEFIGTSISSGGDRASYTTRYGGTADNPHEKFFNNNRGYVRCTLTRKAWQSDFRIVSSVLDPDAAVSTLASFLVEDGRPGAQRT